MTMIPGGRKPWGMGGGLVVAVFFCLSGCADDPPGLGSYHEGCYSDRTCNAGLTCWVDVCVPGDNPEQTDGGGVALDQTVPLPDTAPNVDSAPLVSADSTIDSGGTAGTLNCRDSKTWPSAWTEFETEVLQLTNQRRLSGHNCDGKWYPAVPALTHNAKLTEAARCHSVDMGENDFMGHTGAGNTSAGDRIETAGYTWTAWGENVAAGYATPAKVVQAWMDSPGHCVNIMKSSFEELGVGFAYWQTGTHAERWTQNFGRPQ